MSLRKKRKWLFNTANIRYNDALIETKKITNKEITSAKRFEQMLAGKRGQKLAQLKKAKEIY